MKKKIKVALMSYPMDGRKAKGTALYTRKILENMLNDDRFDFYLVHYEKTEDSLYTKVNEIIMPHVRLPYGSRFLSQMLFFWKYRNNRFDVMHWFQPRMYPFFWLAPTNNIFVTVHGAGDVSAPTYFVFSRSVFNFVLKHFHKWISTIIVVSQNAKEEVIKYYHFSPNKIEVTYNGGGEDYKPINKMIARDFVAKKYGIHSPYIFDLSRLQPHKNVTRLIKSYDKMRTDYPYRKEGLLIVGGTVGNYKEEYTVAQNSIFSKDIMFINFIPNEDLNYFYSGAELFVFPSLSEGFGLPVLEAMASGVPVITSNITSMPEIGGDAVLTINPLDIKEISDTMNKVLTDNNLKLKLVEDGLSRAKEFTWKKTADRTMLLYEKIFK